MVPEWPRAMWMGMEDAIFIFAGWKAATFSIEIWAMENLKILRSEPESPATGSFRLAPRLPMWMGTAIWTCS